MSTSVCSLQHVCVSQITTRIEEVAVKEKRDSGKVLWYLKDEFKALATTPVDEAFLEDYLAKARVQGMCVL